MAVYKWKVPGLIPVDAETAGKELTRIYERDGAIAPETLVNESRADTAPLHHCFEWDNDKAAEKYRISQAGNIIRHIIIENPEDASSAQVPPVRAFVHTKIVSGYEPIEVVISSAEKCRDLMEQAMRDMQWFVQKYKNLHELDAVRAAMAEAVVRTATHESMVFDTTLDATPDRHGESCVQSLLGTVTAIGRLEHHGR